MTLPEHALCSAMLAEFGMRERYGWRGTLAMIVAGIAPDLDTAAKLVGDREFWQLHHALGHGVLPVLLLSLAIAGLARYLGGLKPFGYVLGWCLVAAAAHIFTDSLYWWGVQFFWPFSSWERAFHVLEYLDLFVLGIWLTGGVCLYKYPKRGRRIAGSTLALFATYVALRAMAPQPTGVLKLLMGGWIYAAPERTPVLDWW